MLSSTADNLYWMGRYIERAENTARALDVSYRASLIAQPGTGPAAEWQAALAILNDTDNLTESRGKATASAVMTYLALDRENPSSIYSSIRIARENAHSLRAVITTEMWETLNATWLELRGMDLAMVETQGYRAFFDWVKDRAHLFRGVMLGTLMHDDGMRFVQLGSYLERADNTARLFAQRLNLAGPNEGETGSAVDYYRWGGLLRSLSGFRAYHQIYKDVITATRVAELILLNAEMPRSLRFCLDRIVELLEELGAGSRVDSRRAAGELHSRLRWGRIEDIERQGIETFLVEVMDCVAVISDGISQDFMMVG